MNSLLVKLGARKMRVIFYLSLILIALICFQCAPARIINSSTYYSPKYLLNEMREAYIGERMISLQECHIDTYSNNSTYDYCIEFLMELIYNGISKTSITLTYREFSKSYARPAFFQSFTYDLNQSKFIHFKSILIEVVEANNAFINFKVISEADIDGIPILRKQRR
jgi:hypothetical protein